jgi:hypothetical protein
MPNERPTIDDAVFAYRSVAANQRTPALAQATIAEMYRLYGVDFCDDVIERISDADDSAMDVISLTNALIYQLTLEERYEDARSHAEAYYNGQDESQKSSMPNETISGYIVIVQHAPSAERRAEFRDLTRRAIRRLEEVEDQILASVHLFLALFAEDAISVDYQDLEHAYQLTRAAAQRKDYETAALGYLTIGDAITDAEALNAALLCAKQIKHPGACDSIEEMLLENLQNTPSDVVERLIPQLSDPSIRKRAQAILATERPTQLC